MECVLGIDLGTTFTAIAHWDERRQQPQHFQVDWLGEGDLQSVVYYDPEQDEFLVGRLAYKKGIVNPENMALGVKRMMDNAAKQICVGGREFTPVELSARILSKLYQEVAGKYPNGEFRSRGTVVTVPYYFKAHQCENTRQAAKLADIECTGILQEPIAASLQYAWKLVTEDPTARRKERILIFDLGGGTFDLTLFDLQQSPEQLGFEVLATGGDDRLGGMDFDEALLQLLLQKSGTTLAGLSPPQERGARQKILLAAIEAKHALSATSAIDVTIPSALSPDRHIETRVTRSEFERAIRGYVEQIEAIMDRLWATANVRPSEVDRVIPVGGSSKIPCMRELLARLAGENKIWADTDASLSVAHGAAMYAAWLDDHEVFGREIEVRTRTCHALGVETSGGRFNIVVPANSRTPCTLKRRYTNDEDNMTSLDINVYQGSAPLVRDNALIGTINISGLPPRPRHRLDIRVDFAVTEQQRVSVTVEAEGKSIDAAFNFA